jgi:hypothetical protein
MPTRIQLVRSIRLFAGVAAGLVLLAVLAAPSAAASEVKTFVGMKICRTPFVKIPAGLPGGYCLFTEANIPFLEGAKAHYTDPHTVAGVLNSPVSIVATDERGSTITGHCTYYYPTAVNPGHGLCVYSGGTGRFEGFHARWVIGSGTPAGVSVIGPYWFDRDHEGEHNSDD